MKNKTLDKYRKTPKGMLTNLYGKIKQRNFNKFNKELDFSLKQFQSKYLNDKNFLYLFNEWEESGYAYYKKPSIDRINPDLPYTFENMQMLTWQENRKKGEVERGRTTTSVSMFTIDGKHIKDFYSIKQAVLETGLNQSGIVLCCSGKYRHTGGYVFKYIKSGYNKTQKFIHDNKELLGE